MPTLKSKTSRKLPTTMAALVALFPPRAIHDNVSYDNTQEIIDHLLSVPHRTRDQDLYLDTLTVLLEAYEDEHEALDPAEVSPLEALRTLVSEHAMTPTHLGEILGDRSLGTRILKGQRELSKAHIRALAAHFHVSPALFL